MDAERRDYLKGKIREGMVERGEKPDEEKAERILNDLVALAEIFIESEIKRRQL